ncbi:MAG TPA: hypothetical protein VLV81_12760 [Acidimicrobiia bacterium]|nr:hypothetical protein [Acidimicrobiia bacterium]
MFTIASTKCFFLRGRRRRRAGSAIQTEMAHRLAESVRRESPGRACDPVALAAQLDIRVSFKALSAERGGLEAALVPDVDGPFEIICDPWVDPHNEQGLSFRIAHELAHTLFYDWSLTPPRRLVTDSVKEEEFCDDFACRLLGVEMAAPTAV